MSLKLRNIISMESDLYDDYVPSTEEAEGAVDEVEVVEATDEILSDNDQIDNFNNELDETVQDVESFEETQVALESALANPDYPGLDEVGVEMIHQRLISLSKRRGFDIGYLADEISTENINCRSSNRRRKTEIALEGIKDVLVKMWERIKAAIKAIWQAIKDFWKKHISTMGRLIKSLEKTKRRARDINGNVTGEAPKAPSGVQRAFWVGASKNTISQADIKRYGETQDQTLESFLSYVEGVGKIFDDVTHEIPNSKEKLLTFRGSKLMSGLELLGVQTESKAPTRDKPLVNGWWYDADEEATKDGVVEFVWDQREVKPSDKRTVVVASRSEMETLCEDAIKLIKKTQRFGDNMSKVQSKYDKAQNKITQAINNMPDDRYKYAGDKYDDETKTTKAIYLGREDFTKVIRNVNKIIRELSKISSKVSSLNVTYGRQVVSFCNTCMSAYKED